MFEAAAKQGDGMAQINLARCYLLGIGCERDENEAIKWFEQGAKQYPFQLLREYYERGPFAETAEIIKNNCTLDNYFHLIEDYGKQNKIVEAMRVWRDASILFYHTSEQKIRTSLDSVRCLIREAERKRTLLAGDYFEIQYLYVTNHAKYNNTVTLIIDKLRSGKGEGGSKAIKIDKSQKIFFDAVTKDLYSPIPEIQQKTQQYISEFLDDNKNSNIPVFHRLDARLAKITLEQGNKSRAIELATRTDLKHLSAEESYIVGNIIYRQIILKGKGGKREFELMLAHLAKAASSTLEEDKVTVDSSKSILVSIYNDLFNKRFSADFTIPLPESATINGTTILPFMLKLDSSTALNINHSITSYLERVSKESKDNEAKILNRLELIKKISAANGKEVKIPKIEELTPEKLSDLFKFSEEELKKYLTKEYLEKFVDAKKELKEFKMTKFPQEFDQELSLLPFRPPFLKKVFQTERLNIEKTLQNALLRKIVNTIHITPFPSKLEDLKEEEIKRYAYHTTNIEERILMPLKLKVAFEEEIPKVETFKQKTKSRDLPSPTPRFLGPSMSIGNADL